MRPIAFLLVLTSTLMAAEEPKYSVVRTDGDFQVRRYAAYIVASTVVDSADLDEASSEGFRRLAGYIFGGNVAKNKISMTAPVTAQQSEKISMTAPVTTTASGQQVVITFMMPSEYTLETLPIPNDTRVELLTVPARTVAAISFSGRWTDDNFNEHIAELRDWMSRQKLVAAGEPVIARYNAPFVPSFFRRNEILIEIRE